APRLRHATAIASLRNAGKAAAAVGGCRESVVVLACICILLVSLRGDQPAASASSLGASGRRILKCAPAKAPSMISIDPPCACTNSFTTDNPIPVPLRCPATGALPE